MFKANDQMRNDGVVYKVVGNDATLANAKEFVNKHVRIKASSADQRLLLIDEGFAPTVIETFCKVDVSFERLERGRGLSKSHSYELLEYGLPFVSVEAGKQWSDYSCALLNLKPLEHEEKNGFFKRVGPYTCRAR